jgi:hypothetical protein
MEKETKGCNSEGGTVCTMGSVNHWRSGSNVYPYRFSKKKFSFSTPLILNIGSRYRWVVSFTSRPFYLKKGPLYLLRLDGLRRRSGHFLRK